MDLIELPKVRYRRWRWWSDWVDCFAADYDGRGYIVQMKRNRFGRLRFKPISIQGHNPLFEFGILNLPRKETDHD